MAGVVEGQVVGLGTLSVAPATDSYFCEVTVSPAHRRRGIGTRLAGALSALVDPPGLVLCRAMSSHPLRRAFAEHLGGSVVAHYPMPRVDLTSEGGQQWAESQPLPGGYATTPMTDVGVAQVRSAWSSYFTWAHQSFGPVRVDALATVWDSYSAGLDDTLSQVCVDTATGQIVAVSLVSPNSWEGRTFVVAETVHRDQPDGVRLLQATVASSLRVAGQRGIATVELEGSSTDPHAPQMFQSLPPGDSDPMDIYVVPSPGSPASRRSR